MKSMLEWQIVHDGLRSLVSQLTIEESSIYIARNSLVDSVVQDADTQALIDAVLVTPLLWQASIARDIIFSGFQQELYMADERPIAYWYTAQVLLIHLSLLETLRQVIPEGTWLAFVLRDDTQQNNALQRPMHTQNSNTRLSI